MSNWNGNDFLRFIGKSFLGSRGTNYRLTAKRLAVLLLALALYLPAEILIWSGLLLDELFYPGYRQTQIRQPVFIIGNPRSGTTFLQRLLARDNHNFSTMQTWEIFGAPSIASHKTLRLAARAARGFGVRISKLVRSLEETWQDNDPIHRLKLRLAEEVEYLFIHIFSTLKIWSYAAMVDEAEPYIYFDEMLPDIKKRRMMDFYQRCLQRHLFSCGNGGKFYLSKNPHFSPAVNTLLDRFPDARFIYLIRNPLKAIPSHIKLKEREWQLLGSPLKEYASKEFILGMADHWYRDPLRKVKSLPVDQQVVIRFDDLIIDARGTVEMIYRRLGLDLTPEFLAVVEMESVSARGHQSCHDYSLDEMGIDPQSLQDHYSQIIHEYQLRK